MAAVLVSFVGETYWFSTNSQGGRNSNEPLLFSSENIWTSSRTLQGKKGPGALTSKKDLGALTSEHDNIMSSSEQL